MKLNQRVRAMFSRSTRALFTGSVRLLASPGAVAGRQRGLLVAAALCLLAVGLAVPLTGSPTNGYRNLRAQTTQRRATNSSSASASLPQGGSNAAHRGSAPVASSEASPSTSGGQTAGSSSAGASSAASSAGGSASGGASQPQAQPQTFNSSDQARSRPAPVHLTVGVSDNGEYMFEQHAFQVIHIPTARLMTAWNVAVLRDKTLLNSDRKWLSSAKSDGVTPMVSFAGNGNYIPSYQVYAAAVKAFMHDFPQVKIYAPWNEPDWIYRPALANNPKLAADYFNVLIHWCHGCTIVAGDVYRPASQGLASWVRTYARYLHARPAAWALHPYDDVRSHTTAQIQAFESVTSGPIWLTEISGVERRGHWGFPNQGPNGANNDERFLFELPKQFPRIQRIYHYQWQAVAAAPWDSGLLGPLGAPRPAYWTFKNAVKGKLP